MATPGIHFDSNRAWQQATAALRANRELLLALAGVFFMLPSLAFSLLYPQPVPPAGADQQAMMAMALDYYSRSLPFMLPVLLLQAAGTLGMLTLLTDRSRPTVGQAIRTGARSVLPYLASQLLLGFTLGMIALPIVTAFSLAGGRGLAVLGLAAAVLAWLYGWIRTVLAAPVMAVSFIISLVFSMLGRAVPQLNVFYESISVKTLAGLSVFGVSMQLMSQHIMNYLRLLPEDVLKVAQLLHTH